MPRNAPRPNRTDLAVPKPAVEGPGQPNGLPIQAPTGLPYGENQALQNAQRALPVGPPPMPGPGGPPGGPPPGAPPPGGPPPGANPMAALAAARNFQMPNLQPISAPTQRPDEPVMTGVSQNNAQGGMAAMLGSIASQANSPALRELAARAQQLAQ